MLSWTYGIFIIVLANFWLSTARTNPHIFQNTIEHLDNVRNVNNETTKEYSNHVCETEECRNFAQIIIENMNDTVNPCEDFYEYACGKWPEKHPLPTDKIIWSTRLNIDSIIERQIWEILNTDILPDDILSVQLAKRWYKACTDIEEIEKRSLQPLLAVLDQAGGWPLISQLDEWTTSKHKWQEIDDFYARLTGNNNLHDTRVAVYGKNSTEESVVLDIPNMPEGGWVLYQESLEMEEEEENEIPHDMQIKKTGKYWKFVMEVVRLIAEAKGFNVHQENLETDIENMLQFQLKLVQITSILDDYTETTIGGFQKWYNSLTSHTQNSKVTWTNKIINIFEQAGVEGIGFDTRVKVASPQYFEKLVNLLDKTSNRTIVNYLHWNFISSAIKGTTKRMRNLSTNLTTFDDDYTNEEDTKEKRASYCVEESEMNDAISYAFVKKYFSDDVLNTVLSIANDIQEAVGIQIQESNWANDTIKNLALKKLQNITKNIGYPQWYENTTIINELYNGLDIGTTYFENALNVKKHKKFKELRQLSTKDKRVIKWLVDPIKINAFYLNADNSITLPAANFQNPYFGITRPDTTNFAMAIFLLSHEMIHGFDSLRYFYNEKGETVTWSSSMIEAYNQSIKCFVEQFDSYTLNKLSPNETIENYGEQTKDENMADTIGLDAAYRAYRQREKANGTPAQTLLGLERFNNDQLFFLSFANMWCETVKPENLRTLAMLNQHSTGRLRVIGTLSNNEAFSKAYNCPTGSPMNPEKKCNIWKR